MLMLRSVTEVLVIKSTRNEQPIFENNDPQTYTFTGIKDRQVPGFGFVFLSNNVNRKSVCLLKIFKLIVDLLN